MTESDLAKTFRATRFLASRCFLAFAVISGFFGVTLPANALITNGANAIDLMGQFASTTSDTTPNYTQNAINNNSGATNALGFNTPFGIALDAVNHRLFVADSSNNRVLVYQLKTDNSISTASGGHTAANVLGQPDLVSSGAATTQSGMSNPNGLAFDSANNRLFVADYANSRVLVFNTTTITNGMNATNELGQPSGTAFTSSTHATSQSGMNQPGDVAYDAANNRLFVADVHNNRVLVFNTTTITNGMNATNVLGQVNYSNSSSSATQSTMSFPDGLAFDAVNQRLFVSEDGNERVTVYSMSSISNGMNAANVLGQTDFTSVTRNQCSCNTPTQSSIYGPYGLSFDATNNRLFVADKYNNRVLVFNTTTITNGMNATNVLGQPNFVSAASPTPPTQSSLFYAVGVLYDPGSGRAFASDFSNNRVMIFEATYQNSGDYFNP